MQKWLKNAVIYQIYPQSFFDTNSDGIGDVKGVTAKLDYIKSLGVDVIWLNPIFCSPFMDAGYDVTDFYCVDKRYGVNQDVAELVAKAHSMGLRVVLDLVAGHTSDQHPWFKQSKEPTNNQYTNRYIWTDAEFKQIEGLRTMHGMSDRCGAYAVNFFNHQPALNYGFAKVTEDWQLPVTHPDCLKMREELRNIMSFWFDMGLDGFRVDMASSLVKNDEESKETILLWQEMRKWLNANYPDKVLISEWSQPDRAIKAGFDIDFYIFFHVLGYNALFNSGDKSFFNSTGKGDVTVFTEEYSKLLSQTKDYGYMSLPTGNHDIARLSYNKNETQLRLALGFLFAMPGIPTLYYGDELGMRYQSQLRSKEGGYGRTGSRTPMQWDATVNAGFSFASPDNLYLPVDKERKDLNVEDETADANSTLNFVKSLIAIRKKYPALSSDGGFEVVYAKKDAYPLIFQRSDKDKCFYVVVNPKDQTIELSDLSIKGEVIVSVGKQPIVTNNGIKVFGQTFALIEVK